MLPLNAIGGMASSEVNDRAYYGRKADPLSRGKLAVAVAPIRVQPKTSTASETGTIESIGDIYITRYIMSPMAPQLAFAKPSPERENSDLIMSLQPDLRICIKKKWVESEGIVGLELVSADNPSLPAFSAGSHIDLHLPSGLVRQYSLCNDPGDPGRPAQTYEIGVLRDPNSRGGSILLHDEVRVGDMLPISLPRNHFPLQETEKRSILIARGIGITPLLAMGERLHHIGAEFELHYVTRDRQRAAYVERLAGSGFASRVFFYHENGGPALNLAKLLQASDVSAHLYICGAETFIGSVKATALAAGWMEERIHFEYFANATIGTASDAEFEVVIQSTGQTIWVTESDTIADALERVGIDLPISCMQGVCGTCITRVLEGEVDHRDLYFTPQEHATNSLITPCCSRAKSPRLVLDL